MSLGRKPGPTPEDPSPILATFDSGKRSPREEAVVQDVRLRLRDICGHLSDAEFEALVLKIALVQLKGEGN